jgi:hypothetical protein
LAAFFRARLLFLDLPETFYGFGSSDEHIPSRFDARAQQFSRLRAIVVTSVNFSSSCAACAVWLQPQICTRAPRFG